jgi:membrane protein implicated in regulation of membrane protease activity
MPLSEHEQRILEEIEKRLQEEDPRLADAVTRTSLYAHTARRIRWGVLAFVLGFVMLLLFFLSMWVAITGFLVMLASALLVYQQLRRLSREQPAPEGAPDRTVPGFLARLVERFRGRPHR